MGQLGKLPHMHRIVSQLRSYFSARGWTAPYGRGSDAAGVTVTIMQKAGEQDQLFGSVTAKDVCDALAAKNFTIDRRKIQLDEPIKTLGEFKVPVKLHKDVTAEVTVVVAKEE